MTQAEDFRAISGKGVQGRVEGRQILLGSEAFLTENGSAVEALRGFTADAAWAAHDEGEVGRLAPGLRADFVVLDEDPLAVPGEQLDDLHVRSTWVDGKAVYEAE